MPDLAEEQEIFAATESPETEAAPSPEVVAPVVETPDVQTTEQPQAATQQEQQEQSVPYAALKKEREARKALQARVDELTNHVLRRQTLEKPEEQQPDPEIWDDPTAFIRNQLSPVQNELQQTREFYSQREAVREHGAETVEAAYNALAEAMQQGDQGAQALYRKAMQSMDPYGELVAWHKRNEILSQVGTDPKAYEERLRAKILEELQGQAPAGQQPAGAQPQQSQTQPLPSLNRSYGNAGNAQGGAITEEDIFNAAPAFGRRKA
jgi:hypothetical protein